LKFPYQPVLSRAFFFRRSVPQGQEIKCKIIRKKEGMDKMYPQYELFIEDGINEDAKYFALSARKRKRSKNSSYVISTARIGIMDKALWENNVIGKVR
jgi:hypothetical protein